MTDSVEGFEEIGLFPNEEIGGVEETFWRVGLDPLTHKRFPRNLGRGANPTNTNVKRRGRAMGVR